MRHQLLQLPPRAGWVFPVDAESFGRGAAGTQTQVGSQRRRWEGQVGVCGGSSSPVWRPLAASNPLLILHREEAQRFG